MVAFASFQITELLGEVHLKPKRKTQIDEYIKQLTETLKALPTLEERDVISFLLNFLLNSLIPFVNTLQ